MLSRHAVWKSQARSHVRIAIVFCRTEAILKRQLLQAGFAFDWCPVGISAGTPAVLTEASSGLLSLFRETSR
jgi:hypothetical protein